MTHTQQKQLTEVECPYCGQKIKKHVDEPTEACIHFVGFGWAQSHKAYFTEIEEYTEEEIRYILKVCRDALKAEGRNGNIYIGYYSIINDYGEPYIKKYRNVAVLGSGSPTGEWKKVNRRINYRLKNNWGKYFKTTPPACHSNTMTSLVYPKREAE